MTKKELDVLEKVFAEEIVGSLYQGKCKTVKKLLDEGYLVFEEKTLGKDCLGLIKVNGYRLSFKGNYTYCTSDRCSDEAIKNI